ncbi:putative protein-lysine N-methyltransferase Ecym_3328 [Eremothecium cymbalariae DBVPG|uniref:Protein-lysine N-methyltransferase EFM6 n=1 Tax=Eremothecium cymbalariae (strain CBS 270.75 / DBVPG 7215 / KCTC 17166 / NRRL Y-17582) TaxID=931890 RepID=G8JRP9_ERECY|nr:Hypothetical protein Ecym_3328 [Eremothecium cymbalariae DBVPG\
MTDVFASVFEELVPTPPIEHLGASDLSFQGRLDPPLKIYEDGGESGCGGKVWIAGELLCDFLLEKSKDGQLLSKFVKNGKQFNKVLELGSGTGLVGLCIGMHNIMHEVNDMDVYITDIDTLCPLMARNVRMNNLEGRVHPRELFWGDELPAEFRNKDSPVDLILAADCVYLEKAFPLLEMKLLELTANQEVQPVVLMSYRKRRKADKKFFLKIKKHFVITELTDFKRYDEYIKQRTHIFQLVRRSSIKQQQARA